MTALADCLRALMPFCGCQMIDLGPRIDAHGVLRAAREALRKHAPCEGCKGVGRVGGGYLREDCPPCSGAGWTPASVEAAIKRERERERLTNHALTAARDLVVARDALDGRRKAEPNPDNREPGVPLEVDAGIDVLGDCLAPLKTGGCNG